MGSITVWHLYICCTSVALRNLGGITRHLETVTLATWGGPWWLSSFRLSIWPSNNNVPWSMSSSDLPLYTSTSNPSNVCPMDLFGIPLVPIFNLTGPTTKPFSCRLAVDSVDLSTYWGLCRHSLFGPGPPAPCHLNVASLLLVFPVYLGNHGEMTTDTGSFQSTGTLVQCLSSQFSLTLWHLWWQSIKTFLKPGHGCFKSWDSRWTLLI